MSRIRLGLMISSGELRTATEGRGYPRDFSIQVLTVIQNYCCFVCSDLIIQKSLEQCQHKTFLFPLDEFWVFERLRSPRP